MDIVAVMVRVEHRTGASGVVLDTSGEVWLTHSVDQIGGPRLDDYRPDHLGLEDERTLIGGRLPAGAIEAIVLDDRGDRVHAEVGAGAWAVVLEQPVGGERSPVCFRDGDGVPVTAALPADWERTPVTDTNEVCPACEQLGWDVVIPADGSRGTRGSRLGTQPTPVVVCRLCGHEVVMGAIIRLASRDDEDPALVQARVREMEETQRLSNAMTLSATMFPIYAADGMPGRLSGSGSSGDQVTSVTVSHGPDDHLRHPNLRVETALTERCRHASEETLATEALARLAA
jgi:hypothetical protein